MNRCYHQKSELLALAQAEMHVLMPSETAPFTSKILRSWSLRTFSAAYSVDSTCRQSKASHTLTAAAQAMDVMSAWAAANV